MSNHKKLKSRSGLQKISNYTGDPIDTLLIIGSIAVGTTAAFAWRGYSDEIFEQYKGEGNVLRNRFIYAVIITVIAVVIILALSKIANTKYRRTQLYVSTKDIVSKYSPTGEDI
jgi:Mn2+/Fe2+ NRAMP family transporter